ncbi:MAG: hypothetical protein M0Q91_18415 [Methanoregula sp.]|jgi:hypothetical protein|nr:hypothetical protein [Methanoregula sp.]
MTKDPIPVRIVADPRARNGIWCMNPYDGHPKGCPNFPKCPKMFPNINEIVGNYSWYAVVEEYNLREHADKMKLAHPDWSERQCRNLLYWQGGVRKRLREKAKRYVSAGDILLEIPEACGINMFMTMQLAGITLERTKPDIVRKVMLIGKPR